MFTGRAGLLLVALYRNTIVTTEDTLVGALAALSFSYIAVVSYKVPFQSLMSLLLQQELNVYPISDTAPDFMNTVYDKPWARALPWLVV